jgi:cyclohexanecarboxyl-CoA dehydrogenase
MDFRFSEEEELWQWAVKDFANREIASREPKIFDQSFKYTLRKMGELGFFGVKLPEQYGGDPANWVMLGILAEEVAKVSVGIAYLILVSHEVTFSLASYGTDEAKEEFLRGLIRGDIVGCISSNEPNAGVDFEAIELRADKNGETYIVSGEKNPVSFGMQADVTLSFAKTGPGKKEITAMLIPLGLTGISRFPLRNMGLSLSAPASFRFDGVQIPLRYRISNVGEGLQVNATTGLLSNAHKIIVGLISLGIAQTALKLAIQYSKERVAFGKPIVKFEGLSNKIAEDATFIEAARWLCYRALSLKDRNSSHTKEAAMCGWWCPKIAYETIQDSLLIHGHAGYCDDHPFQQMLRDIVAFELISGTENILKLIVSYEGIGAVAVPDSLLSHFSRPPTHPSPSRGEGEGGG